MNEIATKTFWKISPIDNPKKNDIELFFTNKQFSNQGVDYTDEIKSALFGVAIGDAIGLPVEFMSRQKLLNNPVTDMIGYGTYNQPLGTWSDDSSLTFCLAEALTQDFNLKNIGQNFVKWYNDNYWTPYGEVFDVGITTRRAISQLAGGVQPDLAGGFDKSSNGNGSLMRIIPLVFYLLNKPINERYSITKQVSSLTHRHIHSVIACFYYLEFARQILQRKNKFEVYRNLQSDVLTYLTSIPINTEEFAIFERLLKNDIYKLPEEDIYSGGYVLHTLEASIWCLLTTDSYKEAVLKAVNLGDDTDTTGAVTGGLAGLLYGIDNIPEHWVHQIVRFDDINDLAERLAYKMTNQNNTTTLSDRLEDIITSQNRKQPELKQKGFIKRLLYFLREKIRN